MSSDRRRSIHKPRNTSNSPARSSSPDRIYASATLLQPPIPTRAVYTEAFHVQQVPEYGTTRASEGIHVQSGLIFEDILDPIEQASKAHDSTHHTKPVLSDHVSTGTRIRARSAGVLRCTLIRHPLTDVSFRQMHSCWPPGCDQPPTSKTSITTSTSPMIIATCLTAVHETCLCAVQIGPTSRTTPFCVLSHICSMPVNPVPTSSSRQLSQPSPRSSASVSPRSMMHTHPHTHKPSRSPASASSSSVRSVRPPRPPSLTSAPCVSGQSHTQWQQLTPFTPPHPPQRQHPPSHLCHCPTPHYPPHPPPPDLAPPVLLATMTWLHEALLQTPRPPAASPPPTHPSPRCRSTHHLCTAAPASHAICLVPART